jgi:hypothetical protein
MEIDEVDGDGGDGDGDRWRWLWGHFPVLAGCRNRDFCPPKFIGGSGGAVELFWENADSPRVFPSRELYRRKDIIRGGASWPHHGAAWLGAGLCPLW